MFRKLISNLPFNPSLLGQLSFYAKRIKQEESLRRMGFGFVALAMLIQTFAVIAPPEKSLAFSNDYIINGLRTRDDILRAWDGQTSDKNVADIYGKFGLTRADIEKLPMHPNVTLQSNWADYWTMGRTSLSAVSKASQIQQQYKNSEVAVNYGSGTVYVRQLRAWDIVNSFNRYQAFEGWKDGKQFWILVDCGNLTMVGKPPVVKEPALQMRKTIRGGPQTLKPGQEFSFVLEYRNSVAESLPARDAVIHDQFDLNNFDITSSYIEGKPGVNIQTYMNGAQLALPLGNVAYSSSFRVAARVTVRLKSNLANGTVTCNAAKLTASNAAEAWGGGAPSTCVTVSRTVDVCPNIPGDQTGVPSGQIKDGNGNCITPEKPKVCPLDSSIKEDDQRCEAPKLSCTDMKIIDVNRTTKTFKIRTTVKSSNEYLTSITSYVYDFGDSSSQQTKKSSAYADETSHVYQDGNYTANVVVNYTSGRGPAQTAQTITCSVAADSQSDQPLSQEKTARNLTQNLDEQKTLAAKAKAGDVIEYSLITSNSYSYDRANINTSDYIGDLLDYADLDKAFLSSQGGSYDESTRTISWKPETVKANSELIKKFRIKVKDPVPSTNQPSAMTTAFDCQISNKFGDQIDLAIDCPIPKSAEYVTTTLPSTGPGTSLIIGFTATTIIAYFFARSRLLSTELELIRTDFAQTGGI